MQQGVTAVTEHLTHSLVKALRNVPDLTSFDDKVLLAMAGASANLLWSAGSTVFERGKQAEALYVVLSGRVRIVGEDDQQIADIEAGDYFGEHALLLHTIHSKSAYAVEDSELMVVAKESFSELLAANPELAGQFRRKLESRLAELGTAPRT